MEDYIIYDGEKIEYTINKGKRKNVYICVSDGKIIVKTPRLISKIFVKELMKKHAKDLVEKLKAEALKTKKQEYTNGSNIPILGKDYSLQIIYMLNKRSKYEILDNTLKIYLNKEIKENAKAQNDEIEIVLLKMYRDIAKKEADKLMPILTKKVGLYPKSYTIKKVKTIWGSCSSRKNISLNLELAKYDEKAMRYVIIHELCHLKYMNHSKNFWSLVESNMPEYKEVEKILKPKNN